MMQCWSSLGRFSPCAGPSWIVHHLPAWRQCYGSMQHKLFSRLHSRKCRCGCCRRIVHISIRNTVRSWYCWECLEALRLRACRQPPPSSKQPSSHTPTGRSLLVVLLAGLKRCHVSHAAVSHISHLMFAAPDQEQRLWPDTGAYTSVSLLPPLQLQLQLRLP